MKKIRTKLAATTVSFAMALTLVPLPFPMATTKVFAFVNGTMPSSWSGQDCDTTHNAGSTATYTWNGISSCWGPAGHRNPDISDNINGNTQNLEWECVELAERFMYLADNINPYTAAGGKDVAPNYTGSYFLKESNPANHVVPAVGDIISFGATTTNSSGHVAVIISVDSSISTTGSGNVTLFEQNSYDINGNPLPTRTLTITNWRMAAPSGLGTISTWLHNPANNPAPNIVVTTGLSVTPNPLQVGAAISGGFTVTNTGGQSMNLQGLDLYAAGPNGPSFEVYNDNNSNPIAANATRQLTIPAGTILGQGQSSLISGSYTLVAGYKDQNGNWFSLNGSGGASPTEAVTTTVIPQNMTSIRDASGAIYLFDVDSSNFVSFNISNVSSPGGWNGWREILPGITSFMGKVSAMVDASNNVAISARDASNNIYYTTKVSGIWQNWQSLGGAGTIVSDPLTTLTPDYGHIPQVYAIDASGFVDRNYYLNGSWSGWGPLDANQTVSFVGSIGYVLGSNGFPILFARDTNHNVWVNTENTNSTWTGWQELSGSGIAGDPIATVDQANSVVQVYARGTDGNMYVVSIQSGGQAGYSAWTGFYTSKNIHFVGNVGEALDANNKQELVAVDSSGNEWINAESGSGWTDWQQFGNGNTYVGTPSLIAHANGTLEAFTYATDGSLYHDWQTANAWGNWTNWMLLTQANATTLNGNITSVKDYANAIELYYVDTNHTVQTNQSSSSAPSGWVGWSSIGAGAGSSPNSSVNWGLW